MHLTRGAAWIGGAAVLATWFLAAAGQDAAPRPARIDESVPESEPERAAREIRSQADRLRQRLAAQPAPSDGERNPFAFRARGSGRGDVARAPELAGTDAGDPPEALPEPDPFTLSGIATDEGPDGPIRTAILSGLGDVFLAKAGEIVAARYKVVAVGADAVEVADLDTGRTFRIGLR